MRPWPSPVPASRHSPRQAVGRPPGARHAPSRPGRRAGAALGPRQLPGAVRPPGRDAAAAPPPARRRPGPRHLRPRAGGAVRAEGGGSAGGPVLPDRPPGEDALRRGAVGSAPWRTGLSADSKGAALASAVCHQVGELVVRLSHEIRPTWGTAVDRDRFVARRPSWREEWADLVWTGGRRPAQPVPTSGPSASGSGTRSRPGCRPWTAPINGRSSTAICTRRTCSSRATTPRFSRGSSTGRGPSSATPGRVGPPRGAPRRHPWPHPGGHRRGPGPRSDGRCRRRGPVGVLPPVPRDPTDGLWRPAAVPRRRWRAAVLCPGVRARRLPRGPRPSDHRQARGGPGQRHRRRRDPEGARPTGPSRDLAGRRRPALPAGALGSRPGSALDGRALGRPVRSPAPGPRRGACSAHRATDPPCPRPPDSRPDRLAGRPRRPRRGPPRPSPGPRSHRPGRRGLRKARCRRRLLAPVRRHAGGAGHSSSASSSPASRCPRSRLESSRMP